MMKSDADQAYYLGDLDYDDFRHLARDDALSRHEKIGFPDAYRAGKANDILADIFANDRNIAKKDDAALLYETGQYMMSLVIRAIQAAPAGRSWYLMSNWSCDVTILVSTIASAPLRCSPT